MAVFIGVLLLAIIAGEFYIISLLERVLKTGGQMLAKGVTVMATLEELQQQVTETTNVEQSAILLIQGLATKIQELIDAGAPPTDYQALVDQLNASEQALAAAVQANTPVIP